MAYKKLFALWLFAILLFAHNTFAQDIPEPMSPPRLVNDFVGALSPTERENLERQLVDYNDSTSTQVTVVMVKTTQPYPISDYAFALGRKWGVGQKGKNNGIVLLWATDDRKIFIATGRGMEGAIPDVIARRIVSRVIVPRFKNQMYYQGLSEGVDEIVKYATGEYQANPTASDDASGIELLFFLLIFLFVLFVIIRANRGGGRGGRGGGFYPYSTYSGWGTSSGNWGGSGGWSSGGDGGGFGGFGGGDFGGGGAGGDY